jgi:hypothetical protein
MSRSQLQQEQCMEGIGLLSGQRRCVISRALIASNIIESAATDAIEPASARDHLDQVAPR